MKYQLIKENGQAYLRESARHHKLPLINSYDLPEGKTEVDECEVKKTKQIRPKDKSEKWTKCLPTYLGIVGLIAVSGYSLRDTVAKMIGFTIMYWFWAWICSD